MYKLLLFDPAKIKARCQAIHSQSSTQSSPLATPTSGAHRGQRTKFTLTPLIDIEDLPVCPADCQIGITKQYAAPDTRAHVNVNVKMALMPPRAPPAGELCGRSYSFVYVVAAAAGLVAFRAVRISGQ